MGYPFVYLQTKGCFLLECASLSESASVSGPTVSGLCVRIVCAVLPRAMLQLDKTSSHILV